MNLNFFCLKSYQPYATESLESVLSKSLLTARFQLPSKVILTQSLGGEEKVEDVLIVEGSTTPQFLAIRNRKATLWKLSEEALEVVGSWQIWEGNPLFCVQAQGIVLVTDQFFGVIGDNGQSLHTLAVCDWEIKDGNVCLLIYTAEGSLVKLYINANKHHKEYVFCSSTLQSSLLWNNEILIKDFLESDLKILSTGKCVVNIEQPEALCHMRRYKNYLLLLFTEELRIYASNNEMFTLSTSLRLTRTVKRIMHVNEELVTLQADDGKCLLVTVGELARELLWRSASLLPVSRNPLRLLCVAGEAAELITCSEWREAALEGIHFSSGVASKESSCAPLIFIRRFQELISVIYCCCADGTFFSIGVDHNDFASFYGELVFVFKGLDQPLEVVEGPNGERSLLYLKHGGSVVLTDISKSTELVLIESAVKPIRTAYCPESGTLFISHREEVQRFDCKKKIISRPIKFENPITALHILDKRLLVADTRMSVHIYQIQEKADDYLTYVCGDYSGRCVTSAHFVDNSYIFAIIDTCSCVFLPLKPTKMLRIDPLSAQVYSLRSPLPLAENALREEIKYRHHCGLIDFFPLPLSVAQGMVPEVIPGFVNATLCGVLLDCQGSLHFITNNGMDAARPETTQTLTSLFQAQRPNIKWLDNADMQLFSMQSSSISH